MEKKLQRILCYNYLKVTYLGVPESQIETILIGCLASPALQITLLSSLYKQYIVYLFHFFKDFGYDNNIDVSNKERFQSVYNISDFTLITFLNYA